MSTHKGASLRTTTTTTPRRFGTDITKSSVGNKAQSPTLIRSATKKSQNQRSTHRNLEKDGSFSRAASSADRSVDKSARAADSRSGASTRANDAANSQPQKTRRRTARPSATPDRTGLRSRGQSNSSHASSKDRSARSRTASGSNGAGGRSPVRGKADQYVVDFEPGPLGMQLEPVIKSSAKEIGCRVLRFIDVAGRSQARESGKVRVGDVLVRIDGMAVLSKSYQDIIAALKRPSYVMGSTMAARKRITFRNIQGASNFSSDVRPEEEARIRASENAPPPGRPSVASSRKKSSSPVIADRYSATKRIGSGGRSTPRKPPSPAASSSQRQRDTSSVDSNLPETASSGEEASIVTSSRLAEMSPNQLDALLLPTLTLDGTPSPPTVGSNDNGHEVFSPSNVRKLASQNSWKTPVRDAAMGYSQPLTETVKKVMRSISATSGMIASSSVSVATKKIPEKIGETLVGHTKRDFEDAVAKKQTLLRELSHARASLGGEIERREVLERRVQDLARDQNLAKRSREESNAALDEARVAMKAQSAREKTLSNQVSLFRVKFVEQTMASLSMGDQVDALKNLVNNQETKLADMSEQLTDQSITITELTASLEQKEIELDGAHDSLQETLSSLREANSKVGSMESNMANSQGKLREHQQALEEARSSLEAKAGVVKKMEHVARQAELQKTAVECDLKECRDDLSSAMDRVVEIERQLKESQGTNQDLVGKVEDLKQRLVQSQELLDFNQSTASAQREELSKLREVIADLKAEKERGDDERSTLSKELETTQLEWRKRETQLVSELDKERTSASKLNADCAEKAKEDTKIKQELESLLAGEKEKSVCYREQASKQISELEDTVAQLKQAISQSDAEKGSLRSELSRAEGELDKRKKSSHQEIAEMENRLSACRKEYENQKSDFAKSEEALVATAKECEDTRHVLDETLGELKDAQESIKASQANFDAQVVQMKSSERAKSDADKTLEEKDAMIEELLSSVALMEASSKAVADDKCAQIRTLELKLTEVGIEHEAALNATKRRHADEISSIVEKCEGDLKGMSTRNEETVHQRDKQIQELLEDLDSRDKDIAQLKGVSIAADLRTAALETEVHSLKEMLQKKMALHADEVKSVNERADKEITRVSAKNDMLVSENEKQMEALAEKETLIRDLRGQMEDDRKIMSSHTARMEAHASEEKKLAGSLEAALSSCEAAVSERDEALERISQLKMANEGLLREKKAAEDFRDELHATLSAKSLLVKEYEDRMNEQSSRINDTEAKLNEAHTKMEDLRSTLETIKAEHKEVLAASQGKNDALNTVKDGLVSEVQSFESEMESMREHRADLLSMIEAMQKEESDLEHTVSTLNSDLDKVRQALCDTNRSHAQEVNSLKGKLDEEVAKAVSKDETIREQETKIEELTEAAAKMENDMDSKDEEIMSLIVTHGGLIESHDDLRRKSIQVDEEVKSLRAKLESKVDEVQRQRRDLARATRSADDSVRAKDAEIALMAESSKAAIAEQCAQIRELELQLKHVQIQCDATVKENERRHAVELTSIMHTAEENAIDANARNEEILRQRDQKIEELIGATEQMRMELDSKDEAISALNNICAGVEPSVAALKSELRAFEGTLHCNELKSVETKAESDMTELSKAFDETIRKQLGSLSLVLDEARSTFQKTTQLHADELQRLRANSEMEAATAATRYEEKISKLSDAAERLQLDLNSKCQEVSEQIGAAAVLKDKLALSESSAANMEAKLDGIMEEHNDARRRHEQEVESLKLKLEGQAEDLGDAERKLECARREVEDVERSLYEALDVVDERERMIEETSAQWKAKHSAAISKLEGQAKELGDAEQKLECARREVEDVERRLYEALDIVDEREQMIEETSAQWKAKHSAAISKLEGQAKELGDAERHFEGATREVEDLESRLHEALDIADKRERMIEETNAQWKAKHSAAISQIEDYIASLEKEWSAQLEATNCETEGHESSEKSELEKVQVEAAKLRDVVDGLQAELAVNAREKTTMAKHIERLVGEIDEKSAHSKLLTGLVNSTKSHLKMLNTSRDEERTKLASELKEITQECASLSGEKSATLTSPTDEQATVLTALGALRSAIINLKVHQKEADVSLAQMKTQMGDTQRKLDEMTRIADDAALRLREATEATRAMETNANDAQAKFALLEDAKVAAEAETLEAKEVIAKQRKEIETLETNLECKGAEAKRLLKHCEEMDAQLSETFAAKETLESVIQKLNSQLSTSEKLALDAKDKCIVAEAKIRELENEVARIEQSQIEKDDILASMASADQKLIERHQTELKEASSHLKKCSDERDHLRKQLSSVQHDNRMLSSDAEAKATVIKELRAIIQEKDTEIKEFSKVIAQLKSSAAATDAQLSLTCTAKDSLESEVVKLESQLLIAERTAKDTEGRYSAANAKVCELEDDVRRLDKLVSLQKESQMERDGDHAIVVSELQKFKSKYEESASRLNECIEQKAHLKEQLSEAENEYRILSSESEATAIVVVDLRVKIQEKENLLLEQQKACATLDAQLKHACASKERLESEVEGLCSQCTNAEKTAKDAEQRNSVADSKITELQAEIKMNHQLIDQHERSLKEKDDAHASVSSELDEINSRFKESTDRLSTCVEEKEYLTEKLSSVEHEYNFLCCEAKANAAAIAELTSNAQAKDDQIADLRSHQEKATRLLKELKSSCAATDAQLSQSCANKDALEVKLDSLSSQCSIAEKTAQEAEARYSAARSEIAELRIETTRLTELTEKQKKSYVAKDNIHVETLRELEQLKADIDLKTGEMSELRSMLDKKTSELKSCAEDRDHVKETLSRMGHEHRMLTKEAEEKQCKSNAAIDELRVSIDEKETEIVGLKMYKEKSSKLQSELDEMSLVAEDARLRLQEAMEIFDEHTGRMELAANEADNKLSDQREVIESLEHDLECNTIELKRLMQHCQSMEARLCQTSADKETLESEVENLTARCSLAEKSARDAESKITKLEDEVSQKSSFIAQQEQSYAEKNRIHDTNLAKKSGVVEEQQTKLNAATSELINLTEERHKLKENIDQLQVTIDDQERTIVELRSTHEATTRESTQLSEQLEVADECCGVLKESLEKKEAELVEARTLLTEAQIQRDEFESAAGDAASMVSEGRSFASRQQKFIQQLQSDNDDKEQQIADLEKQVSIAEECIHELRTSCEESNERENLRIKEMEVKCIMLEEACNDAKGIISDLEISRTKDKTQLEETEGRLKDALVNLAEREAEVKEKQTQVTALRLEVNMMETRICDLHASLSQAEEQQADPQGPPSVELDQEQEQLCELKVLVGEMKNHNTTLSSELQETKAQLVAQKQKFTDSTELCITPKKFGPTSRSREHVAASPGLLARHVELLDGLCKMKQAISEVITPLKPNSDGSDTEENSENNPMDTSMELRFDLLTMEIDEKNCLLLSMEQQMDKLVGELSLAKDELSEKEELAKHMGAALVEIEQERDRLVAHIDRANNTVAKEIQWRQEAETEFDVLHKKIGYLLCDQSRRQVMLNRAKHDSKVALNEALLWKKRFVGNDEQWASKMEASKKIANCFATILSGAILGERAKIARKALAFGKWKQMTADVKEDGNLCSQLQYERQRNAKLIRTHTHEICTQERRIIDLEHEKTQMRWSRNATALHELVKRRELRLLGGAFRRWACASCTSQAVATHVGAAEDMAVQLENTRAKLVRLKSHLRSAGMYPAKHKSRISLPQGGQMGALEDAGTGLSVVAETDNESDREDSEGTASKLHVPT